MKIASTRILSFFIAVFAVSGFANSETSHATTGDYLKSDSKVSTDTHGNGCCCLNCGTPTDQEIVDRKV